MRTKTNDDLEEKIKQAREYITTRPWVKNQDMMLFSYLIMSANVVIVKDKNKGKKLQCLAYSDENTIYIYDTVVKNYTAGQIAFILLHEILHHCKNDFERVNFIPEADRILFNYASDVFINTWLEAHDLPPPSPFKGTKVDIPRASKVEQFLTKEITEYTTEQLYYILKKHAAVDVSYVCGFWQRAHGIILDKWKDILPQVYNLQKAIGQEYSPFFKNIAAEYFTPKVEWHVLLNKFLRSTIPQDYTIENPDIPMFINHGLWLPDVSGKDYTVIFVIDVSGSMSLNEINHAITEINNLIKKYNAKVLLITSDNKVRTKELLKQIEIKTVPYFGGGTDFVPAIKYAIEHYNTSQYVALIYFTDGVGTFPSKNLVAQLRMPLIWLMTTDVVAPVGETIKYETDGRKN